MKAIIDKLFNGIKARFNKITLNGFYTSFLMISLFLYGLNAFMITGQIFLLLLIVVVSIKMIFCGELRITSSLILVCIFSLFLIIFNTLNYGFEIKDFVWLFICPIGLFIVGSNLIKTYKKKQKLILNVLFSIAAGFALQATLHMIARGFGYGFFSTTRAAVNFWTDKYITVTGVSTLLTLISSFIFPIAIIKSKEKKWYHVVMAIFGFIIAIATSLMLSNRSPLVILLIVCLAGVVVSIFFDKKSRKRMLIIVGCIATVIVIVFVTYKFKVFGLDEILLKIPYFKRIFMTDNSSPFFDSERLDIYRYFFRNWLYFPFGGAKIPLGINKYCHNVWLDIYFEIGIFPAICFIFITLMFIKRLFKILLLEKDLFLKTFLICSVVSLFLIFAIEPVYQSNRYVFMVFFLLFGLSDEFARELGRDQVLKFSRPIPKDATRIIFISNDFSLHKIALCREMMNMYGDKFKYIAMDVDIKKENALLKPYSDISSNCVVNINKEPKRCQVLLDEADVLIFGNAPDRLMLPQLKKGKLVFKYTERLYKSKWTYKYLLPRSIISQLIHHKRFQKYHMYYLCASAYASLDFSYLDVANKRCFKWGYFAVENKFENFDELFENKNKSKINEIIFVNRLIKWKHPEKCIIVAMHLQKKKIPFIMRLIGVGDEKTTQSLRKAIAKADLSGKVILMGAIKNEKVRAIMERANIVLANSDYGEGWGVCINEALESGCAIVASHSQGAAPYLIQNNVNGLIYQFGDDVKMCSQVERLCENRDLQKTLGRNAFYSIKQKWNAHNAVMKFSIIVDKMLRNESLPEVDQSGPMGRAEIINHDWLEEKENVKFEAIKSKDNVVLRENKKESGQIRKGASISYIAVILYILAGLIYTPWMIRTIGKESYSIYTLAISVTGFFALDFGLSEAVSKYLAKYRAENDPVKANKFMGLIYKLFLIIDVGIFVALLMIFVFMKQIYGNTFSAHQLQQLRVVFVMVGFYSLVSFASRPMNGIFVANEKFAVYKGIDLAHKLITIIMVVGALLMGYDLYAVVLANCLAGIICIALRYIYMKKNIKIKPDFKYKDKALTKCVFKFSMWIMAVTICQKLIFSVTPTVLSIFNGDKTQIAIWGIAIMIESYSFTLSNVFNDLFLPKISKMDTNQVNSDAYTQLMIKVGRIQLLTSGMILLAYISLGRGFLHIWLGSSDFDAVYYVGLFILLPSFVTYTQRIGITVLVVKNKIKYHAYSGFVAAGISVFLSIILCIKLGAVGSAIGIFIGETLGYVFVLNYFFSKKANLNIKQFFKNVHLKFILQMVVCLLFGIAIELSYPITGWIVFILKGSIFVLFYLAVMWLTAINQEEKNILWKIVSSVMKPLKRIFKKLNN